MTLKIGNSNPGFNKFQADAPISDLKSQTVSAVAKPKLPPTGNSVTFTALGCDTEIKLARACYMAAAARAGISDDGARRAFADRMITEHSANLELAEKHLALDDAQVKSRLLNQHVNFNISPEVKANLEEFRAQYVAAGGKISFNKTPTIDLREPQTANSVKNDLPSAPPKKFNVLLNGAGNPTDKTRVLAQFAENRYKGGNLWGQNYVQIAELSVGQSVAPKITNVTRAGNKYSVEFELTPLDQSKIHENYKTIQETVNKAVAAYEDFADNNEISSFMRGTFNGALKSVKGAIGLLNLPETIKAVGQIVAHPAETFNALYKELGESWEEFKTAPSNKKSEMIGELVGQAVVEILLGKGIGKAGSVLAKTKTGAELLEKAKLVKTATVAKITESFSDEAASAAASRLRGRLQTTTLYAGVPADALTDLTIVAANKVKNGVKDFAEFSEQMVQKFGEKVRPELRKAFDEAVEKVYGKRRTIETHDVLGGHTYTKHIDKSIEWLKQRLIKEPDIPFASSFKNAEAANRAELKFVKQFEKEAGEWAKYGDRKIWNLEREMDIGEDLGIVVGRGKSGVRRTTRATFRIIRDETEKGWHIVTSFPSPK